MDKNSMNLEKGDKPFHTEAFDRGLEAEEIIGIGKNNNDLVFLIKFKDLPRAELVPASIANVKIPQMVIEFYEKRTVWE